MGDERQIDVDGPVVSAIGLGCMSLSSTYGAVSDDAGSETLLKALDAGVTHFDSADAYGQGQNESLLGRALGARRDEFCLATKFGYRYDVGPEGPARSIDSSGAWARVACEGSLRRLGTDVIDLYYLHRRDPETPIEETVSAMAGLVEAGKVRHLGLSEVSSATLRRAHAIHPIAAVQMEYSLFSRDVEGEMLSTCRDLGVALIAYAPVGRGWLTGTLRHRDQLSDGDSRVKHPRFTDETFDQNRALVDQVALVAAEVGVTPAQAALAWLLAQGRDVLAIPGTRSIDHVLENLGAADVVLSPAHVERLTRAVPPAQVAGGRSSAANLRLQGH